MLLQSKPWVGICTDLFVLGNNMREKKCSLCLWLPYLMLQMDCIRNGVIMMYSSVHTVFCPIKYNLLLISAFYLHYTSHEPNCSTIYIVVNPINDQNVCFFYLEQHQFLQNNSFKNKIVLFSIILVDIFQDPVTYVGVMYQLKYQLLIY